MLWAEEEEEKRVMVRRRMERGMRALAGIVEGKGGED